jgi:hypothetical protein
MEVLEEQHNMPYTLRRPMFRGGKPNAYGTGITSNLESRRGFANGPERSHQMTRSTSKGSICKNLW